jgi:peptidoglycan/LPS O-acetylase OafA/YrhL
VTSIAARSVRYLHWKPQVLSSAFSGRSNSLGFLRWLFATMVIVDHAFPIGGFNAAGGHGGVDPTWAWSKGQDSLGGIAVAGFFVISGFLVTRSWYTSGNAVRYLWRRIIRIFPGFLICLLVTAYVLSPIAWHYENGGWTGVFHVTSDTPWGYFRHNMFLQMHQWNVGNLFQHVPYRETGYPPAWDGSLWTLIYEFKCYILLGIFGLVGLLRYKTFIVAFWAMSYLLMVSWLIDPSWAPKLLPMLSDLYVARYICLFFLGTLIALYADRIIIDDRFGLTALVIVILTLHNGGWLFIGIPAFAYLIIWMAVRLPLRFWENWGDISYGTYIWAFPLQMLLAQHGFQKHGTTTFILASMALATGAAFLSWHLVEKWPLKLKSWTPSMPHFARGRVSDVRRSPAEPKAEQRPATGEA